DLTNTELETAKANKDQEALKRLQAEYNELTTAVEHPVWVPGRTGRTDDPGRQKPIREEHAKGFHEDDVDKIADYLVGSPPPLSSEKQADRWLTRGPLVDGASTGAGTGVVPRMPVRKADTPPPPSRLVTRPVEPGTAIRTLDERTVPDEELHTQTLTKGEGTARTNVGQASFTDGDWAQRASRYPAVTAGTTYADHRRTRDVLVGAAKDLPWQGRAVSFFAAHGTPTQVTLTLEDGTTVTVSGRELARYLQRHVDLGPKDRPIVLYSCSTGASPAHGGLPVAQHIANVTGRPVYAPTTDTGTAVDHTGRVRPILYPQSETDDAITPGRWQTFTPEPTGDTLTELARTARLHHGPGPLDPWTANRTLQLIRTLRDTLGTGADTDPDLLQGLAALDALRWNGTPHPYADGRMTANLLTRMTRDLLDLHAAPGPSPVHFMAVLSAASTADPATAPNRLAVPRPGESASSAGTATLGHRSDIPARDALLDGRETKSGGQKQTLSKEAKAAQFNQGSPDPRLNKLLSQPGYATGDQFGIAAALIGDPQLHVLVLSDPSDPRDKGQQIADFYKASGIAPER
ncbi:hypothetical protein ACGFNH_32665, partial [Streptomyces sp. NPDC048639]